jgi:hypothetical protein
MLNATVCFRMSTQVVGTDTHEGHGNRRRTSQCRRLAELAEGLRSFAEPHALRDKGMRRRNAATVAH